MLRPCNFEKRPFPFYERQVVGMAAPKTVVICALLVFIGSACSDDEPEATQPSPTETTFEQGTFDNLPIYPRSEPLGERNEKDGVVSRSYRSTGIAPQTLLGFYADELEARNGNVRPRLAPSGRAIAPTGSPPIIISRSPPVE